MVALLVRVEVPEKFSEAAFVPVFAATKSFVRDIDDIGTIPHAEAKARAAILRRNVGSKT